MAGSLCCDRLRCQCHYCTGAQAEEAQDIQEDAQILQEELDHVLYTQSPPRGHPGARKRRANYD